MYVVLIVSIAFAQVSKGNACTCYDLTEHCDGAYGDVSGQGYSGEYYTGIASCNVDATPEPEGGGCCIKQTCNASVSNHNVDKWEIGGSLQWGDTGISGTYSESTEVSVTCECKFETCGNNCDQAIHKRLWGIYNYQVHFDYEYDCSDGCWEYCHIGPIHTFREAECGEYDAYTMGTHNPPVATYSCALVMNYNNLPDCN
ncbi:MAG: hypothetical protein JXI43_13065 [Tissierellales bacterium]|nr:hypothetical protein [Tissierellales bacterium]